MGLPCGWTDPFTGSPKAVGKHLFPVVLGTEIHSSIHLQAGRPTYEYPVRGHHRANPIMYMQIEVCVVGLAPCCTYAASHTRAENSYCAESSGIGGKTTLHELELLGNVKSLTSAKKKKDSEPGNFIWIGF